MCRFPVLLILLLGYVCCVSSVERNLQHGHSYVKILGGLNQKSRYNNYRPIDLLKKASINGLTDSVTEGLIRKTYDVITTYQDKPEPKPHANYKVSNLCLNHTKIFLEGLINGEEWAMRSM